MNYFLPFQLVTEVSAAVIDITAVLQQKFKTVSLPSPAGQQTLRRSNRAHRREQGGSADPVGAVTVWGQRVCAQRAVRHGSGQCLGLYR